MVIFFLLMFVDCYPAIADVINLPNNIQTIEKETHQMSTLKFKKSLTVAGESCDHITRVTPNLFWVSDAKNKIFLANTSGGDTLHHLRGSLHNSSSGLHAVNDKSELIYIDEKFNIKILSVDRKTTSRIIGSTNDALEPFCLYWARSSKDLLVGTIDHGTSTGKVIRYSQTGRLTQTIELNNVGLSIYKKPLYITENNNGDIVVSDYNAGMSFGAVVVTDGGGLHRFSYKGHPLGSELGPKGICTNALSHILVCDDNTHTVQMLDKNGQFLSHLLIRPPGIFNPTSLSYDYKTNCLWVGSGTNNKMCAYMYISGQDTPRGMTASLS